MNLQSEHQHLLATNYSGLTSFHWSVSHSCVVDTDLFSCAAEVTYWCALLMDFFMDV